MTLLRILLSDAIADVALSLADGGSTRGRLQMEAGKKKVSRPVIWQVKTAAALFAVANWIYR